MGKARKAVSSRSARGPVDAHAGDGAKRLRRHMESQHEQGRFPQETGYVPTEIGRASCRERV